MSCPFRRSSTNPQDGGSIGVSGGGAILKRSFTSRQNSIQMGPNDEQEDEDTNTLNLKNLNEAILILTSPSVSIDSVIVLNSSFPHRLLSDGFHHVMRNFSSAKCYMNTYDGKNLTWNEILLKL